MREEGQREGRRQNEMQVSSLGKWGDGGAPLTKSRPRGSKGAGLGGRFKAESGVGTRARSQVDVGLRGEVWLEI